MNYLFCIFEIFQIEDIFIWGSGMFLLIVLAFSVYTIWNRLSRKDAIRGLPPDDSW